MTDLSPMERAVRALHGDGPHESALCDHCLAFMDLLREDPEAASEWLAGAGLERYGVRAANGTITGTVAHEDMVHALQGGGEWLYRLRTSDKRPEAIAPPAYLVSEGEAVIEGRVVELEPMFGGPTYYRVKPERSDRHTEDAW